MATTTASTVAPSTRLPAASRQYWFAVGSLLLVFAVSSALYADRDGTLKAFDDLRYPGTLLFWPTLVAKVSGIAVVLIGRSRTLTLFAYAGFLFDLLLAFQADAAAEHWGNLSLVMIGLLAWVFAFRADRQRFGAPGVRLAAAS